MRAAIWFRLLTGMSEDDLITLQWAAIKGACAVAVSGAESRLSKQARTVLKSLPRFTNNSSVFFSLNGPSRDRFARGWQHVVGTATLLDSSAGSINEAVVQYLRRKPAPDLSDYSRSKIPAAETPAKLIPFRQARSDDGRILREDGMIDQSIEEHHLDNLLTYFQPSPASHPEIEQLRIRWRRELGGLLAAIPKECDKRPSIEDIRTEIKRLRKAAKRCRSVLDETGFAARQELAVRGFSASEQQLIAIESPVTVLNGGQGRKPPKGGQGRAALNTMRTLFAEEGGSWTKSWPPNASPLDNLLIALERVCVRTESKLKGEPGAPAKGRRDATLHLLAKWFDRAASEVGSDSPSMEDRVSFVEECLQGAGFPLSPERIEQILCKSSPTLVQQVPPHRS